MGRLRAATLGVSSVALAAVLAAPSWGQELRRLPVYDAGSERPDLQVAVWESPAEGSFPLSQLGTATATATPAVRAALGYLDAVVRGRLDRLAGFYAEDADLGDAREAARLYRRFTRGLPGDAETLSPQRVWHFGPYRVVVLRLESAGGASRMITVSLEALDEGFVRRDQWGSWQPVQELLWYLAGTLNTEPGTPIARAGRNFPHAVLLAPGGGHDLRLELDGVHYAAAPGGDASEPGTVRAFVHRALEVADSGDDDAYLALWDDHGQQRLAEARQSNRPLFDGSRRPLRALGPVRDRLTLPLGDFAMHYFIREAEPRRLRAVLVRQQAGGFGLSDRLPHNLKRLLDSSAFRQALQDQLLGVGG